MLVNHLFQQIIGLFLMMGMGYLLVKLRILQSSDSRILSMLTIYIVFPCVNINAFMIEYTPEILRGFVTAVGICIVLHILLFFVGLILKKGFHLTDVERLSVICPNAGNMVIPLVTALFGSEWVIYASAFVSVQLFFLWIYARSVMSGQKGFDWKQIVTNMNLITVTIGLILFLLRIELPPVALDVLKSVSGMVGPISMIMIRMMIAAAPVSEIVRNKRIYIVSLLRLLAVPLMGAAVLKCAGALLDIENEQTILTIILLALITPVSSTITQLAQLYDNEATYCSEINVMTTLLCIVTMPLVIAVFQ